MVGTVLEAVPACCSRSRAGVLGWQTTCLVQVPQVIFLPAKSLRAERMQDIEVRHRPDVGIEVSPLQRKLDKL